MSSLLIMSCSKTKKRLENVSAIDLYDGQAYRVIKKSLPDNIEILIISAKYGPIRSTEIISYYDQVMTVARAAELRSNVENAIRNVIRNHIPEKIFISLGFPYNLAVSEELMGFLDENFYLQVAHGPIGKRLHQLKVWLEAGK
jgi:hypothetical protein